MKKMRMRGRGRERESEKDGREGKEGGSARAARFYMDICADLIS